MKTIYFIICNENLKTLYHTLPTNLLKIKDDDAIIYISNPTKNKSLSKYIRSNFNTLINNGKLMYNESEVIDYGTLLSKLDVEYIVNMDLTEFIGKVGSEVKTLGVDQLLVRGKTKAVRKQSFILNSYNYLSENIVESKDLSIPMGG